MINSMLMTVGTTLNLAKNADAEVTVFVGPHCMTGKVIEVDGHGAVLQSGDTIQVIRIESIDAVQVSRDLTREPMLTSVIAL